MAIPYVLVTSCVVIAAGTMFHGEMDENLASDDIAVMQTSPLFGMQVNRSPNDWKKPTKVLQSFAEEKALPLQLPTAEKVAASLVKRNAFSYPSRFRRCSVKQQQTPFSGSAFLEWDFHRLLF